MLSAVDMHQTTVISTNKYLEENIGWLKRAFPHNPTIMRLQEKSKEAMEQLGLSEGQEGLVKERLAARRKNELKQSPLQNKFELTMTREKEKLAVDASRSWMAREHIHAVHEEVIFGIRDQTVAVREIKRKIWNIPGPSECRLCGKEPETVDHIVSGCCSLGFTDYLARHNSVAKVVFAAILRGHKTEFHRSWWKGRPPGIVHLGQDKRNYVRWEPRFPTVDRLEHHKPDLFVILPNNKQLIIEVTVCRDDKACTRAEEKAQKYIPLAEDLARQTGKHPIVIPIAIGATGAVSKMTEDAIKKLNGMGIPLQLSKLQRAAAIGTAKIMQKHINTGS